MKEYASNADENTQVLVTLIRERGAIQVANEILAVATRTAQTNASDQALSQIDHLSRVARTITSKIVRGEIDRLQAESTKLSDRVSAVETARKGVQGAARSILDLLSVLEGLIEPGLWDKQAGVSKPTSVASDSASSKFDLSKLRAVAATPIHQWDGAALTYVSRHMEHEVESFHALFVGFVDGGEYDEQFQMIVKIGHLHRLIHLQSSKGDLSSAVTKLKKHLGELSKAATDLGNLESHVDKWWGSFSAGIMGSLPDGEMTRALAPLVRPIRSLDPSWLAQVSQQLGVRH